MLRAIGSFLDGAWRLVGEFSRPTCWAGDPTDEQVVLPVDVRAVFPREAQQVAERLLQEVLGTSYVLFRQQGYIDFRSSLYPDIVYRLRRQQPIEVYKRGRREAHRLCVLPREPLPAADELLVKLLWLRTNEARLLATANRVR